MASGPFEDTPQKANMTDACFNGGVADIFKHIVKQNEITSTLH